MTPGPEEKLSPYGKTLLKALGGDMAMVRATPAAIKRWGADRPESVLEVLPEEIAKAALALPEDMFAFPVEELEKQAGVTRQDRRVRIQFWEEYERAHRSAVQMDLNTVVKGTGLPAWEMYWSKIASMPVLLAWLLSPPPAYRLQMQEGHELGLNAIVEILSLPLLRKDKDGNDVPNIALGLLKLQAFKAIDARLHGAITQKMVQVQLQGGSVPAGEEAHVSMDEVEKRLALLEAELDAPTPVAISPMPQEKKCIEVESEPMERAMSGGKASQEPSRG